MVLDDDYPDMCALKDHYNEHRIARQTAYAVQFPPLPGNDIFAFFWRQDEVNSAHIEGLFKKKQVMLTRTFLPMSWHSRLVDPLLL